MVQAEVAPIEIRYFTTPIGCSCKDWLYRGRLRACKHVTALRQARKLIELQAAHNEEVTHGITRSD